MRRWLLSVVCVLSMGAKSCIDGKEVQHTAPPPDLSSLSGCVELAAFIGADCGDDGTCAAAEFEGSYASERIKTVIAGSTDALLALIACNVAHGCRGIYGYVRGDWMAVNARCANDFMQLTNCPQEFANCAGLSR